MYVLAGRQFLILTVIHLKAALFPLFSLQFVVSQCRVAPAPPALPSMADSFTPNIAPQTDDSGSAPEQAQQQPDATDPVPITEQEVGEYREQDRYLPVSSSHTFPPSLTSHRTSAFSPFSPPPRPLKSSSFLSAVWPPPPPIKIANVSRIMKNAVPPTAKIAKDAKECVQECVSEFISFITSEAAEKCQLEKRKTIGGEDILYAMVSLGFENYAETLKIHLAKLRQVRIHILHPFF